MDTEKEDSLTKQAIKGSFWNIIANLIQKLGGLVFTIVLARFLLPEGFGLYNLAISVATLFFIFSQSGPDRTLGRYISASVKNKQKEKSYFQFIFKIKVVLVLAATFLLILFSYPISVYVLKNKMLIAPLLLSAIFFFFTSLEQFFSFSFFAVKKVEYRAYKELIYQILRVVLVLFVFLSIHNEPSVTKIFFILIFCSIIALFYSFLKANSSLSGLSKGTGKKVLNFMWLMSWTAISIVFLGNLDTIMLGFILEDTISIGLYKAAFLLVSSVSSLIAFSSVLIPFFVKLRGKRLNRAFKKSLRYMMIIAVPSTFGIGILGNYFLILIYGREYLGATLSLYFLLPLIILTIYIGLYRELFASKERPELILKFLVFVIVLNILLNYALIKVLAHYSLTWAITGAAIATTVSWGLYTICLGALAKKELNVGANLDVIIKPLFSSVIMAIVLVLLKDLFADINLLNGSFLVLLGALLYFFVMFLIKGINKEDYIIVRIVKDKVQGIYKHDSQKIYSA